MTAQYWWLMICIYTTCYTAYQAFVTDSVDASVLAGHYRHAGARCG